MKCDCFIIIFYGEKTMDLFEYAKSKTLDQESPLASRLRPTTCLLYTSDAADE